MAWLELQSQAAPHLPSRQITFPLRLLISGIQHNTLCSNHWLRILDMIITILLRLPGERKSHHNRRVKDGLVIDMDFRMPCTNIETLSTSFGMTYSVTYNPCSPYISVPTQIQTVNPIWTTCANPWDRSVRSTFCLILSNKLVSQLLVDNSMYSNKNRCT